MLEGVNLGFEDKNHMMFSACRECSCFRAIVIDGNSGFCCCEGDRNDNFISFDYPCMDGGDRLCQILKYQENDLPEDCQFHTQCSMLNWTEDESVVEEIASEDEPIVEKTAGEVDLDEPAFKEVLERDAGLSDWCRIHSDASVFLLKKSGNIKGFVFMTSEKDADYSWIQPTPPSKHYLQKGSKVVGIRLLWVEGNVSHDAKSLLGMAYLKAVRENADDFYAIAYEDTRGLFSNGGFRTIGYFLGGNGLDDDAGACVLVKKVKDLEDVR